ncbi:MAG: phospholipase A [Nibricoccus sp.]
MAPGQNVEVSLVLLNPGQKVTRATLPIEMFARLVGDGREWPVPIYAKTMPVPVIGPGAFSHATCVFLVPNDAKGRLVLEIADPMVRAIVDVKRPEKKSDMDSLEKTVFSPLADEGKVPALAEFHRVFAENISTHLPIYFIGGPKKPAVKFQFSFKYRVFGDNSTTGTLNPPLRGLFFGYTQRSVWDITSYSSPFYDTSYMPELMWESLSPAPAKPGFLRFRWFGYQISAQHESNGRDGDKSRSLNLVYIRPIFSRDFGPKWSLLFAPKIFYYVDNLSDNPDLERYRGYGEYQLVFARRNGWNLGFLGRIGSHFDRGSVQLDFTYPLQVSYGHFANFLLLQYFDGYGESLLSYNTKSRMLRAGFSLVR